MDHRMQTWDIALRSMHIARRWWLLVIIAGLISGTTAGYLVRRQPAQYLTRTTLMVGTNLRNPNPTANASGVSMVLAAFYAEMAIRAPITGSVIERLKLPISAEVLSQEMISTRVVPQAQLIEISVRDTNPERAARIANTIAEELIAFSPNAPEKIEAQRRFVQAQIADLEATLKHTDQQIQELNTALQSMTSAGEIGEAQQRLRELELIKTTTQSNYTSLVANLNDSSLNTLVVFEPALAPTEPVTQRIMPAVVLAVLLGLALGMGTALLLDMQDDRWRRDRRPDLLLGEPLLGTIAVTSSGLLADADLARPRGRQCLALRSELLLLRAPQSSPTIMLTSAYHSAGRSRLCADLARLFARSGQQVLLVDASMTDDGITALHGNSGDSIRALLRDPSQPIAALQHATDLPDLMLLPGRTSPQDAQLLPTLHWPQAVAAIEQAAELSIIDGPPVLEGADTPLLAPCVGGIVLVIDPATEQCSETRRALERLRAVEAPLLGIVMLSYAPRSLREMLGRFLPNRKAAGAASALH